MAFFCANLEGLFTKILKISCTKNSQIFLDALFFLPKSQIIDTHFTTVPVVYGVLIINNFEAGNSQGQRNVEVEVAIQCTSHVSIYLMVKIMAIPPKEFQVHGYKIRKMFA